MFSQVLLAALASVTAAGAAAEPRMAAPVPTAAASPAVPAVPAASAPSAAASPRQRYCVDQTTTGSRVRRRVCDTRAGWMVYGFDPLTAPRAK